MPDPIETHALPQRIEAAIIAGDGPSIIKLANELRQLGRSETARTNRTNKKKALHAVRAEWVAKHGVDPLRLHALATLHHETATNCHRKWNVSVEVALAALRPDLSHRRGIFRPGIVVPPRLCRPVNQQKATTLDEERVVILRKLRDAIAYEQGALAPHFAEITLQAKRLELRQSEFAQFTLAQSQIRSFIASHRPSSRLALAIAAIRQPMVVVN